VLKYLGKDPNAAHEADYRAAAEVLKPIRKYIRTFDNTNLLNAVPNKELCVFNTWSGDYATAEARAKEAGIGLHLAYFVPDTGSLAWVDCWSLPADASNKAGAHAFLNYLLEPEVAAQCTNLTHFANANKMALPLVDHAISSNPAIYPDSATMTRLTTLRKVTEEQERLMTRIWTDVKSG
jgi:putrescine transport system substrate-binding protein